jgi:hypothetical protein
LSDISPDRFIDNVFAYQRTAAVKAAIELDLFSAIGAGADSVETLAAKVNASPRGVRILSDYLTVQELLIKDGQRYRLTPSSSVFLDKRSPACMASVVDFLTHELMQLFLEDPAAYVRNGGSIGLANLAPDHRSGWGCASHGPVHGARRAGIATNRAMALAAQGPRCGGRPGVFGSRRQSGAGRGYRARLATGLEVALRNARASSVCRTRYIPAGSAFDVEWGTGYDLVLIPNLHHFDRPKRAWAFSDVHDAPLRPAALPGGGGDGVTTIGSVRPFPRHSFVMLASTSGRCLYSSRVTGNGT